MRITVGKVRLETFQPIRLCSGDRFEMSTDYQGLARKRIMVRLGTIHRLGLYDYCLSTPKRNYLGHSLWISLSYWLKSILNGEYKPIRYYI